MFSGGAINPYDDIIGAFTSIISPSTMRTLIPDFRFHSQSNRRESNNRKLGDYPELM